MTLQRFIIALVFLFRAAISPAQPLSPMPGAFADLPLGVRPAGMGGAYTALSNDGNAVFYNPAATAFVSFASLTATATRLFNMVPATYLGVHYPAKNTSWLAGVQQIGDDLMRETTLAVAVAVRAQHIFPASFRRIPFFDRMALSLTLRARLASFGNDPSGGENRITGSGSGYAMDLGYFVHLNRLRLGATLHDLIGHFQWRSSGRGSYVQNMPRRLSLGIAYAEPSLRFSLDMYPSLYRDLPDRVAVGLETNLVTWLVLRAGVTQNVGGLSENKFVTLGFGVYRLKLKTMYLAIQGGYRTGDIASTYQFSIDLFWPNRR